MEKRLNKKLENFIIEFKENISKKAAELQKTEKTGKEVKVEKKETTNDSILCSLVQYIYDYPRITFTKEDVEKRKRVKNIVPLCDRCIAKRAANLQCTRKKKTGQDYCGTHLKGTPHGLITDEEFEEDDENGKNGDSNSLNDENINTNFNEETKETNVKNSDTEKMNKKKEKKNETIKVEVWAQDIQGIMYYIDKVGNVYNAEDVIRNKANPNIIAKYSKIGDKYSITHV